MSFHRDRHTVLAGNVANVDTPGYRPFDMERATPVDGAGMAMTATREGHLNADGSASTTARMFDDGGDFQSADGNAVDLERELAKIDANRVRYSTSSELVSRRLALLKYAATDGA